MKLDPIQPRHLRFRSYYRLYLFGFGIVTILLASFWGSRVYEDGADFVLSSYMWELSATLLYFAVTLSFYAFWLRAHLQKSIQVFPDHLVLHKGKNKEIVNYSDVENVNVVWGSIFYVKTKSGHKHYFNSSFERIDYIWEGLFQARPDLFTEKAFEEFRVKLVQYDHHQKRKEWFFKHKLVDIFNWSVVPLVFVLIAFIIQSKNVHIHHQGLYFFRLFMYSMLVTVTTAFVYSIILKKFVFDKKVSSQIDQESGKVRDLEFEGVVLQRSKVFQMVTACFLLALLVKFDVNLFSVSKVKDEIANFKMKKGNTILIDNRYNCINCKYQVHDGDYVIFGRGTIGQILAKEGDFVGEVAQDKQGRMIASENVMEVPKGHVAIKAANGKDIVFVKIEDLIGKIQN